MATKHFIVTDKKDGTKRLVQASSKAAALQHVIGDSFSCEPAKAADVIAMVQSDSNVQVEIAKEEPKGKKADKQEEAASNGASGDASSHEGEAEEM